MKVNLSAAPVELTPSGEVTVTSTVPAASVGAVATIWASVTDWI